MSGTIYITVDGIDSSQDAYSRGLKPKLVKQALGTRFVLAVWGNRQKG